MRNTENKFKQDGLWYIAVEQYGCRNCAFSRRQLHENMWGCSVPHDAPECCADSRSDNRNVIFVRSDVDNLGGEE